MDRLQVVVPVHQPPHLHDDDAARIARGLRHRQQLVVESFLVRADVAARIGRGATQQNAMQREARIEQIVLAAKAFVFDPRCGAGGAGRPGARVDGRTLVARVERGPWVDKRMQADPGQHARLAAGDGAIQVRQHALREIEGVALLGQCQRRQPRRRAPMAADHAARHAGVAEMVDAALGAVTLAGGVHQREVARLAGRQEAPLQRVRHGLCVARADEARAGHRPARLHQPRRFLRCDDLHVSSVWLGCRRPSVSSATRDR